MSAYSNQVKDYVERYKSEVGIVGLVDPHDLAMWAHERGLIKPNRQTIIDAIASDIAQVFREEYRTDPYGRRYRAKHAVNKRVGNRTMSLWGDMDDPQAPRDHFVRSFSQRRQQIVGDCVRLKTDVDVYNSKHPERDPIQAVLDFTQDVAEVEAYENVA